MTLGSLFDGSGGFCLAGMLNGIEPVWASEIEMFPIRVSTKRIPSVRHYGDVSRLSGADLPPVDIVTFGSPCQDLSTAGLRAGLQDGERSSLFFEAVRVIKEMRDATDGRYPRYAVWENVPGAFSSNGGEDFRIVIETLARVKANVSVPRPKKWDTAGSVMGDGYSIAWRVLDAQYWGVPQRRRRIFLVCDFDGRTAPQYYLSQKACKGILRRAEHRGKTLPPIMAAALKSIVGSSDYTPKIQGSMNLAMSLKPSPESTEPGGQHSGNRYTVRQASFAEYRLDHIGATLRYKGGDGVGGSENMVIGERRMYNRLSD